MLISYFGSHPNIELNNSIVLMFLVIIFLNDAHSTCTCESNVLYVVSKNCSDIQ